MHGVLSIFFCTSMRYVRILLLVSRLNKEYGISLPCVHNRLEQKCHQVRASFMDIAESYNRIFYFRSEIDSQKNVFFERKRQENASRPE